MLRWCAAAAAARQRLESGVLVVLAAEGRGLGEAYSAGPEGQEAVVLSLKRDSCPMCSAEADGGVRLFRRDPWVARDPSDARHPPGHDVTGPVTGGSRGELDSTGIQQRQNSGALQPVFLQGPAFGARGKVHALLRPRNRG